MNNQRNSTDRQKSTEKETLYPIIQNNRSLRNKILNDNENNTMKSLKTKTLFQFFNNKNKKMSENKNHIKAKSLKVIHSDNKYFKMKKFMDKKMNNFFNKNNLKYNEKIKNTKKSANNSIFKKNEELKNNTNEMNDILNELLKLKQKINVINIIKRKRTKNSKMGRREITDMVKSEENSKSIDKPHKTKYRLALLINKNNNLENSNKDEKKIINNKTEINFHNFKNGNKMNEVTKCSESSNKKKKGILKLSLARNNTEKNNETNSLKKEISKSVDKKGISYNYSNRVSEQENYIDKIRDNEFAYLYNRFKKSMKRNKKEEICHRKSLVFPSETVNYIIKMKNELIIDKYRNQYLKKFDNYKYNTQKILKVIKHYNKSKNKIIENYENNLNRSNIKIILTQKINDIKENDKENDSNNYIDDKFNLYNDKDYFDIN